MKISDHLDKNNLHHAYLIEGDREKVEIEISEFVKSLGIETVGNPDFYKFFKDNFKIDDAFSLRSMGSLKASASGKKIYLISANTFTLDAQGVLLKMFEEPIEDTHIFLIVPSADALLKTLVSRFYFIKTSDAMVKEIKMAERFIKMSLQERINFIKELLVAEEGEDEEDTMSEKNSVRTKAVKFLNALEMILSKEIFDKKYSGNVDFFEQIFNVRKYLRQPGSATKTLMESVALSIPKL